MRALPVRRWQRSLFSLPPPFRSLTAALYEGGVVRITVTDRGVGIADVEKAMQPMYTTGDPEERTGLGFAVMQSFMDKVHVSSRPGRGTRVTLTKRLDTRR